MLLSPRCMDPTRYTVAVGEVAFHIRNRRGLGCAGAACCAWAAPRKARSTIKIELMWRRLSMQNLLRDESRVGSITADYIVERSQRPNRPLLFFRELFFLKPFFLKPGMAIPIDLGQNK